MNEAVAVVLCVAEYILLCLEIIRVIIVSAFRTLYSGAFAVSSITPVDPPLVDSRQTCRIR